MVSSTARGRPRPLLAGVYRKACNYCVRSKRGCNGGTPCEQCSRRKQACTYSQRRKSGPRGRSDRHEESISCASPPSDTESGGSPRTQRTSSRTRKGIACTLAIDGSPVVSPSLCSAVSSPTSTAPASSCSSSFLSEYSSLSDESSVSSSSSSESETESGPNEVECHASGENEAEELESSLEKKGRPEISGGKDSQQSKIVQELRVSSPSPKDQTVVAVAAAPPTRQRQQQQQQQQPKRPLKRPASTSSPSRSPSSPTPKKRAKVSPPIRPIPQTLSTAAVMTAPSLLKGSRSRVATIAATPRAGGMRPQQSQLQRQQANLNQRQPQQLVCTSNNRNDEFTSAIAIIDEIKTHAAKDSRNDSNGKRRPALPMPTDIGWGLGFAAGSRGFRSRAMNPLAGFTSQPLEGTPLDTMKGSILEWTAFHREVAPQSVATTSSSATVPLIEMLGDELDGFELDMGGELVTPTLTLTREKSLARAVEALGEEDLVTGHRGVDESFGAIW